jgi:hypothetical protein
MTAAPHKNRKSWLLVTAAIALPLILLFGIGGYRVYRVAALQNAMANPADISLGLENGTGGPEWAEKVVEYVVKFSGRTVEEQGALRERLMAVFRSKTDFITLQDPHGFSTDTGRALQRFPDVRWVVIRDVWQVTPEGEVKTLLDHLRQMEDLELIYIHASALSDTAFASLAGHPKLRAVSLDLGSCSPKILETLKTLPSLKELTIDVHNNPAMSGKDTEQIFRNALPGVQITFASP